jgi:acyl transferase domain-containing protein
MLPLKLEPMAIIGFSFRLPGDISDEAAFWEVMQQRKNLMTEWPESRFSPDASGPDSMVCDCLGVFNIIWIQADLLTQ